MSADNPPASEQAQIILRDLREIAGDDLPAWIDEGEIADLVDEEKPVSVNLNRIAENIL